MALAKNALNLLLQHNFQRAYESQLNEDNIRDGTVSTVSEITRLRALGSHFGNPGHYMGGSSAIIAQAVIDTLVPPDYEPLV
jgi:hypothetical protein